MFYMVNMSKPVLILFFAALLTGRSTGQVANRYDIVIDELMADPAPVTGLPNNEWIELRNTSLSAINLSGWRIGDAGGRRRGPERRAGSSAHLGAVSGGHFHHAVAQGGAEEQRGAAGGRVVDVP